MDKRVSEIKVIKGSWHSVVGTFKEITHLYSNNDTTIETGYIIDKELHGQTYISRQFVEKKRYKGENYGN